MKKAIMLLLPLLLPLMSLGQDSMLNRAMPLLPAKTLDGKTIDKHFYEGHLTVVSFMFIGCMPCMNEIGMLNKIKHEYSADPRFQLLCIPSQMRQQMVDFNADNDAMLSKVRKVYKVDPIEYQIQPSCADGKSRWEQVGDNIKLGSECKTIEETYGATAFPTIFFVDKKGIIRKIDPGGPLSKTDTAFYNNLKKEINTLLRES